MTTDQFQVYIEINEGLLFASVLHVPSNCGADFYENGEELEFVDNDGLFSNCSAEICEQARKVARGALS
jgi:hypothetical protein